MQRAPRTLFTAVVALAAGLVFSHACARGKSSDTGSDAGDAGDAGGARDAGDAGAAGDAGGAGPPADAGCTSDDFCGQSRWCEQSSGTCRDAKPCPQGQGNCDYQYADHDYCDGQRCFCDPVDQACKPLHTACTRCARNVECGTDSLAFLYPADCVPPDAGVADGSVCLPRRANCPPGYQTPASGNYCIPGGGHCGGQGACSTDADCDPHSATPLCNSSLGLCVAACSFDLKTGDSTCPTGQVCHLTPILAQLPPQDPNFAKGRCAAPCTSATACGAGLVCRSEGLDHPVQRCGLAPPQCLGDVECPDSPSTYSLGYCDLAAHACRTDCRTGTDCHAGYLCDAASHACVAETCLQAGGAASGCDYGQFCCGETAGPSPCPAAIDGGACYDKPEATWCGACSSDDDCNKAPYPLRPGNPNKCIDTGKGKVCALGCDTGQAPECPRSWSCENIFVGCSQDSDCGSQGGAHCDLPSDGGSGLCTCTGTSNCPNDANNVTTCRSGKCVFTSVCRPACP